LMAGMRLVLLLCLLALSAAFRVPGIASGRPLPAGISAPRQRSALTVRKPDLPGSTSSQYRSRLSSSLISPEDSWGLWSAIALAAGAGLKLEQKTKVGRALSGAVSAMLITTVLTNVGVLPAGGSVHVTALQGFAVKLATPLLLLGADLVEIFSETGALLRTFFLGTLGTLMGSLVAYLLFANQLQLITPAGDGWRVAGCITAKNIGGGFNFMAVADILNVAPTTISAGLAADNVMGLIYFPLVSWLGGRYNDEMKQKEGVVTEADPVGSPVDLSAEIAELAPTPAPALYNTDTEFDFLSALSLGLGITALSEGVGGLLGIPAIALSSLLSVLIASTLSKQVKRLVKPGEFLGKLLLLVFVSSIGISGGKVFSTLTDKSSGAAALVGYGVVLYSVHFATVFGLGKLFKLELPDILLGSNANVGNAATASALAISMGWQSRLLPAILIGNLGSFLGTFAGLWLASSVLQPMYLAAAKIIL